MTSVVHDCPSPWWELAPERGAAPPARPGPGPFHCSEAKSGLAHSTLLTKPEHVLSRRVNVAPDTIDLGAWICPAKPAVRVESINDFARVTHKRVSRLAQP